MHLWPCVCSCAHTPHRVVECAFETLLRDWDFVIVELNLCSSESIQNVGHIANMKYLIFHEILVEKYFSWCLFPAKCWKKQWHVSENCSSKACFWLKVSFWHSNCLNILIGKQVLFCNDSKMFSFLVSFYFTACKMSAQFFTVLNHGYFKCIANAQLTGLSTFPHVQCLTGSYS